jgi:drug/metabolite transporter (DMT)-like permease
VSPFASGRTRKAAAGVVLGALLFALSVPAGKALLGSIPPLRLSGLLYIAAGIALAPALFVRRAPGSLPGGLGPRDLPWLLLAILAGGCLAPLALFLGLHRTPAGLAALLLNLEAVFTVAIAVVVTGERLGTRGAVGAAAVIAGGVVLSLPSLRGPAPASAALAGPALVVLATALWGADNNLTRRVSLADARAIVALKGLLGGSACLLASVLAGERGAVPGPALLAAAGVGAVSYGLSIVLYVSGLRDLGAAGTGALFALAPGIAAVLSWTAFGERPAASGLFAFGTMTLGAVLLANDRHEHFHVHEPLEHAHEHEHDDHHRHDHAPGERERRPHVHAHRHEPLAHAHPHEADVHHRHRHGRGRSAPRGPSPRTG